MFTLGGRIGEVTSLHILPSGVRGSFAVNRSTPEAKMPSKKKRIAVYLGPEEYENIQTSAQRAGLSLSTFCKRVCIGIPAPSMEHRQAVNDILKANADLGCLGGLLKLALSEGGDKFILPKLLREIDMGQKELKAAARKIA
jgi:hypothetical protein